MGKNKLWFKIVIYVMIASMLLSVVVTGVSLLGI
ncbi:stressosome-associated protein Prli42 [Chengkuizengella sediminis]|nr:stressosome-associated protein Prli42 [Chengkuizengella sediminis]NDI34249.1 stressosome-associated protein Prli42 [Chengkuizengella sediminis]